MKKITLLFSFLLATVSWQITAQAVEDNFDSYAAGDDPTGWTKYQTETDDPGFIITSSEANSAPNSLYHNDDDVANESTSWIVAPVYTATGDDMVEFYYRQNWTSFAYNYSGVWYSTTGSDPTQNPGDWTQIAEFNGTDQPYSEGTWTQFQYFFTETAGTNIYVAFKYTGDYAHEFYIDDFKLMETPSAFPPVFTLTANPDCANTQFSVDVNVTDLGGASSVTVTDDQGSASQQLTAPGSVTFGPYTEGTNVTFTVTNDQDTSISASDQIEYYCPPANDDCDNATALTVNTDGQCTNVTSGTNLHATPSSQPDDVTGYPDDDVWFSFVATETAHKIELTNVTAVSGTSIDMGMGLYDGSNGCANLTLVDDSDPNSFVANGLTVGTTYYLRVYGWYSGSSSAQTTFDVCVTTLPQALSNQDCASAAPFTLDSDSCSNYINVHNFDSTDSGVPAPSCGNYQSGTAGNGDLWYAISIPTGVTEITLNVDNVTGLTSVAGALYSGDCSNLTEVSCTQLSSGWPWTISGLTSGDTYYLRVWDYNNNENGSFDLCGYYTPVSISENQIAGFKFYPNPVNHTLNLSAKDNIEVISISNVMGQEVLHLTPNATETKVKMSQLQNGIYFVKAQVNGELTAFKVIKK